ncbi:MAG: hypothetical protein IT517_02850 [Burkholderiales bacterium]|nr:hypothetical protein [Burkholderiales bacterium]
MQAFRRTPFEESRRRQHIDMLVSQKSRAKPVDFWNKDRQPRAAANGVPGCRQPVGQPSARFADDA